MKPSVEFLLPPADMRHAALQLHGPKAAKDFEGLSDRLLARGHRVARGPGGGDRGNEDARRGVEEGQGGQIGEMGQRSEKKSREAPAGASLKISHPDKVFWPEEGYTKLDLARYYEAVFPKLKPYVQDRLLSLERCPEGLRKTCFFQKEAPQSLPAGTPTKAIQHSNGTTTYVVGGRRNTHLALVNLGCIAVHVWESRVRWPRKPDWVCFDLDPGSGKFGDAARVGLHLKQALEALGLLGYPKSTGKRGLHVFVPIRLGPDTDQVRQFAATLAQHLAVSYPEEITVEARLVKRKGRVYLDTARNGFGQTVVAPYSVRWSPGAPISVPLDWSEVTPAFKPMDMNLATIADRLRKRDPWTDFFRRRQGLERAIRAVRKL